MSEPAFPDVEVVLTETDGNAFSIMGAVSRALKRHGVREERIADFRRECMSGDYDNLLRTCMAWVSVV